MPTIWFALVAGMITIYVVLDGFDIGAGMLQRLLARTEAERRIVRQTIGPVWDGNEVWLIAGGGTLYFAFPLLYASGFSGFYLPLIIVLWLLILRGIGIEFRSHAASEVWRGLFDAALSISSLLLALFYGAALANVLRGVPLQADGYFFEPLWTNGLVGRSPGVLDWYTVIGGITAVAALAMHGAVYVALKTSDAVNARAHRLARRLWMPLVGLTAISLLATIAVRPAVLDNFRAHPVAVVIPLAAAAALGALWPLIARRRERAAFTASAVYLAAMLAGAAAALYPDVLPAAGDPALSLTIDNAAAGPHALSVGLIWWSGGMLLAIGYITLVYWMFRGKVPSTGA